MKRIYWINGICSAAFLFLTISAQVIDIYLNSHPIFRNSTAELTEGIQKINDIEHLRKVALVLVNQNQSGNETLNLFLHDGLEVVASLGLLIAIVSFNNFISLRKRVRHEKTDMSKEQ
jgi:hypothetical protein